MRIIKVYGALAKFLGQRSFKADVQNPAEAVRFLLANFPNLKQHMADQHYKVSVGKFELPLANQPEVLHYPTGKKEPIRIVPVFAGAGSGVGNILAGIGLIALALINPFGAAAIAGTAISTIVGGIGVSLTLGGVAQLLTPTSQASVGSNSPDDPRKSFSFSGIQNVSRSGVPVPIVYGEMLVGSLVISAGITSDQIG